jgi:hypothetical protein
MTDRDHHATTPTLTSGNTTASGQRISGSPR